MVFYCGRLCHVFLNLLEVKAFTHLSISVRNRISVFASGTDKQSPLYWELLTDREDVLLISVSLVQILGLAYRQHLLSTYWTELNFEISPGNL